MNELLKLASEEAGVLAGRILHDRIEDLALVAGEGIWEEAARERDRLAEKVFDGEAGEADSRACRNLALAIDIHQGYVPVDAG